jgi:hypothetical protein
MNIASTWQNEVNINPEDGGDIIQNTDNHLHTTQNHNPEYLNLHLQELYSYIPTW